MKFIKIMPGLWRVEPCDVLLMELLKSRFCERHWRACWVDAIGCDCRCQFATFKEAKEFVRQTFGSPVNEK